MQVGSCRVRAETGYKEFLNPFSTEDETFVQICKDNSTEDEPLVLICKDKSTAGRTSRPFVQRAIVRKDGSFVLFSNLAHNLLGGPMVGRIGRR